MARFRIKKILATTLALGALAMVASGAVTKTDRDAKPEQTSVAIYPLADLPVFRSSGSKMKFDPSAVIALIRKSVPEKSWEQGTIKVFSQNLALVIQQTEANHATVKSVLDSLRKEET